MRLSERFAKLFSGLKRAYGVFEHHGIEKDTKKIKGKYKTISGLLDLTQYEDHLKGRMSIGIVPIKDNAKCSFAAIDIDDYQLDKESFIKRIEDIPCVPCRSKSGGMHLYFFFKKPVSAKTIRKKLKKIASLIGFSTAEIFPKQIKLGGKNDPTSIGSWINLPYFKAKDTSRYAVVNRKQLSLQGFLKIAEENLLTESQFLKIEPKYYEYFHDGPPCLQILSNITCEEKRNNFIFNVATYYKSKDPENWKEKTTEINNLFCNPPLDKRELKSTVAQSQSKKDYAYTCEEEPIKSHCKRDECVKRKYGISSYGEVNFSLDSLVKLNTSPPTWYMSIDDTRIEMQTDDLLNQHRFRKVCMEKLAKLPPKTKAEKWDSMIRTALETVEVIEAPYDASPAGQLENHLSMFLATRSFAKTKDEIHFGKPWVSDGYCYFKSTEFIKYLQQQKFPMTSREIWAILHDLGGKPKQLKTGYANVRTWGVPYTEDKKQIEIDAGEIENDF